MRIVHTSDWHAGRVWKSLDRLPELAAALDSLARFVEEERVDLVLMTGDVFDAGAPPAKAERVVFRFFRRLADAGAQTVVIAGNHDNAHRLEAWGALAELASVHAVGRPRSAGDGGLIELRTRSGQAAQIAAVPFASPRLLVSALEQAAGDEAASLYEDRMRRLIAGLCRGFRDDAVRLLCLHTHLEGALLAGSERRAQLGRGWVIDSSTLPTEAHYIGLGHIHKPQMLETAGPPTCYAGSPLQLDFGEAGETKTFTVIDVQPDGAPARVEHAPYEGAKPLVDLRCTLPELESRAEELRQSGWLRVTVKLDERDPEVNRRVRTLLPNAVSVDVELPLTGLAAPTRPSLETHRPAEVFRAYYRDRNEGREPDSRLIELFESLNAELETG